MIIGIDIGGTTTKIGIVTNDKIIKEFVIKTHPQKIAIDIKNAFEKEGIDYRNAHAIGIAVPGFIDHKKGIVVLSGNMNYKNYNLKAEVEKVLDISTYIVNDANAAALGEYWVGAGKHSNSAILYTLGTGVGGGIIIDNELVFGTKGYAGELGHGGFFQSERKCTCGLSNCLEPMSSAKGIEQSLFDILGKPMSVKDAAPLFKSGDKDVLKAFRKSLQPLARHISIMETAINPEMIIIGGGPSNIGKPLADFIEMLVEEVQLDFVAKATKIRIAQTMNQAGIYGAAYWAMTEKAKEEQ